MVITMSETVLIGIHDVLLGEFPLILFVPEIAPLLVIDQLLLVQFSEFAVLIVTATLLQIVVYLLWHFAVDFANLFDCSGYD